MSKIPPIPETSVEAGLAWPLETERLVVREMVPDDFDAVYVLCTHPDTCRYIRPAMTAEAVREHIAKRKMPWRFHDLDWCASVVVEKASNQIIGEVTFRVISLDERRSEIGFRFHPDFQGKGYASEATQAILNVLFKQLNIHKVIGQCDVRNRASFKLMENLGMRREGKFLKQNLNADQWCDVYYYAILEDEWI